MKQIIETCTHIDPEKRYGTAQQVRKALERLVNSRHAMDVKSGEKMDSEGRAEVNWGPFWPIPGFRSKKPWHMMCAALGYWFIFYFTSDIEIERDKSDAILQFLDQLCIGAWLLFLVFMVTDYGGLGKHLPLVRSTNWLVKLLGYVVWTAVSMVIAILICFCERK